MNAPACSAAERADRSPRPAQGAARSSARVYPGEVYAIIGANGAGKSTLLRTHRRPAPARRGPDQLDGKDMTELGRKSAPPRGIVMVPEGRRLFASLTVEENLQVGAAYARKGPWTIERGSTSCSRG